jgi:putative transposase
VKYDIENIDTVGAIHESSSSYRKSLRLKGYDYSKAGAYFVTICIKDMVCMFGEIVNGEMILNKYGTIANKYLTEIPEKYNQTRLHEFVVMPNHIHAIIEITGSSVVGAIHESPDMLSPKISSPDISSNATTVGAIHESPDTLPHSNPVGAIHESPLQTNNNISVDAIRESQKQELPLRDQRRKMLLSKIVGWYKMNTAKQINIILKTEGSSFWQRNYYEHIIRNEKSYQTIADYIMWNPKKWKDDKFYKYAD